MAPLVTIGLPVYKRLGYLPQAVRSVCEQDYAEIELIVSDNGENETKVADLVANHCERPFRFRQNPSSVSIATHFSQLVDEATGDYFVLLADDDEISPNFVSDMLSCLEEHPEASVAISRVEIMDEAGQDVSPYDPRPFPPPVMSGEEFIRVWCRGTYGFVCFASNMARTEDIRKQGNYPDYPTGNGIDNALLIKLCLGSHVAFQGRSAFRYRVYEASEGLSASYKGLALATRCFLEFLDTDDRILAYAQERPEEWADLRRCLRTMTWLGYHDRWETLYRRRLSTAEWVRAGFALPPIPRYYRAVVRTLWHSAIERVGRRPS